MKFNFKKIASVLTSVAMIGSTIGIAAAANYPAPFVVGGTSNVAIVYGANAAVTDSLAAGEIQTNLALALGSQDGTSGGTTEVTGGDSVKLEKATNKFNLGNALNAVYPSLSEDEFSTVLKDGKYLNDENAEFEYEQTITLGSFTLSHFQDSSFNDNKPVIGFDLSKSTYVLNYTLEFKKAAEGGGSFVDLENTDLEMLGKVFYISDATNSTAAPKLTLLDAANSATISEGDVQQITVGDVVYDVSLEFIGSTTVKFKVNDLTTNSLSEGQTFKVADDVYLGVKDILVQDYAGGIKKVEYSLGSGKIVMEHGQEVEVNEDPISDIEDANEYTSKVTSFITTSTANANNVEKIVLEWKVDDDAWIVPGTELTMPGFNTIKMSVGGFQFPTQEITKIEDDGDAVSVSTFVKDGAVDFHLWYANDTVTSIGGLGEKSTHQLVTNSTAATTSAFTYLPLNETKNSFFVATWISGDDSESYVLELKSIDEDTGNNATTLDNLAADGTDITIAKVGNNKTVGNIDFTLIAANEDLGYARIGIKAAGSGAVYADRIVTKSGLQFRVPTVLNISSDGTGACGDGCINQSLGWGAPTLTSWVMNFTEEDKDGTIASGKSFTVTTGLDNEDGTQPTATSVTTYETEEDSDKYTGYLVSDLATKVTLDKPSSGLDTAEIAYAGEEAYGDVYISEIGALVTTNGGETPSMGDVTVTDAEIETVKTKNLVVVGGSCINIVAAKVLGKNTPVCGAEFTTLTGVEANQALIKVAANPYTSGKIAMLIAGYNADDTSKAAKYVTTETIATTEGTTKKLSTSSTVATVLA